MCILKHGQNETNVRTAYGEDLFIATLPMLVPLAPKDHITT